MTSLEKPGLTSAPYDEVLIQRKKTRKRIIIGSVVAAIVVILVISISVGVTQSKHKDGNGKPLKTMCSLTEKPDLCQSSISSSGNYTKQLSIKDMMGLVIDVALEKSQLAMTKLTELKDKAVDPNLKAALDDCEELFETTMDQLSSSSESFHNFDVKAMMEPSGDVQTWLSAALTNLETCLGGMASNTSSDVKSEIEEFTSNVSDLIANALAVSKRVFDIFQNLHIELPSRRLLSIPQEEEDDDSEIPKWVSPRDRKLLQTRLFTPNAIVSLTGDGHFKTINASIEAAPKHSKTRHVILVKAGVYYENLDIPKSKTNLVLMGEGMDKTIITGNRSVVDGWTTFRSATVAVSGMGFIAVDIQFRNTAGAEKHQAVALRVGSDKSIFYRCKMAAYQDTMYAHSLRQFYRECVIIGTVDFIFGNAVSTFQECDLLATKPNLGQMNIVTAQGRTDKNMNTGIVIHKCRIKGTPELEAAKAQFPTYLGRPWKMHSRTVVMNSYIGDVVRPDGWLKWNDTFAFDTLVYREFNNTGPGANTTQRVKWAGYKIIMEKDEAMLFALNRFLPAAIPKGAGVPYKLGL